MTYQQTKIDPQALVGYEFIDLEMGLTESGRGTVAIRYKVIEYLSEKWGTHYYKCLELDKKNKPIGYSMPKTYSLENIFSII